MTNKTYVLDTSVLVDNPISYKDFSDSVIIIPIVVFNELDSLKKQPHERGRNARVCIKTLEEVSLQGDINIGVQIENNILLKVDTKYYNENECSQYGDYKYGDSQILAVLLDCWQNDKETTLVSNDINLRIKARARGVQAISHVTENKFFHELYTGFKEIEDNEAAEELRDNLEIDNNEYGFNLLPNECVIFTDKSTDNKNPVLGRLVEGNKIKLVERTYPWNIKPRNSEQELLCDMFMDNSLDLVTANGSAGTGKSLIALAAALELVVNKREFNKLIIFRPIQDCGPSIGFLPGTENEKISPYFSGSYDTFEFLFSNKAVNSSNWKAGLEMLQKKGLIELAPMTYIRGRSICNAILIVDETQNVSPENIKTVLTRVGENSRVFLLGDIEQVDANFDAFSNGLTYVIERFKTYDFASHITLIKGERSKLATIASKIL
jgi:PhoH-like ATPase